MPYTKVSILMPSKYSLNFLILQGEPILNRQFQRIPHPPAPGGQPPLAANRLVNMRKPIVLEAL